MSMTLSGGILAKRIIMTIPNNLINKIHHFYTVMIQTLQFFFNMVKPFYSANLCYNFYPKDFKNGGSALECGCTKK